MAQRLFGGQFNLAANCLFSFNFYFQEKKGGYVIRE